MKPEVTETPLTERKMVRRGLLAGLAGLSAAVAMKLAGTPPAHAIDNASIIIGNDTQTAQSQTRLTADPVDVNLPTFQVVNGGNATSGQSAIAGVVNAGTAIVGVNTNPTSGIGVLGVSTYFQGTGTGVQGYTQQGIGVLGWTSDQTGTKAGIEGRSFGSAPGIRAVSTNNGTGIKGISNANFSFTDDGTGSGPGVHGKSNSGTGVVGESQSLFGVYGQSYGASAGVEGIANATGAIGVQGQSGSGTGIQGQSGQGCGVRGLSSSFVGLIGISDASIGLYGYNVSPNVPALYAENLGPNNRIAGLFNGDVRIMGTLSATSKNAVVTMPDGSDAVLYCQEAPEPYFEDFGRAQLAGGRARVQLEVEYASLVRRDDYMVFLTEEGESNGLFVSRRDQTGFEVQEKKSGTSSIQFTYRIVGRRADIPGKRLARISNQAAAHAAQARAAAVGKGTGGAKPGSGGPGAGGMPLPAGPSGVR